MDVWKPDVLYKVDLILGESARWHAEWQKKYCGLLNAFVKLYLEKLKLFYLK